MIDVTARTIPIDVGVDERRKVTIRDYYTECKVGDLLEWKTGPDIPWVVRFARKPPGDEWEIHGIGPEQDAPYEVKRQGHFPYMVVILDKVGSPTGRLAGRPTIVLEAACPEIIVN